jgi:transcriptional repressor NrdR
MSRTTPGIAKPKAVGTRPRDGLRCPNCGSPQSKITKVRFREQTDDVRRKHRCIDCGQKFSSLQVLEIRRPSDFSS